MDTEGIKRNCQSLAKIDDDIHGKGVYHFKISPSSLLIQNWAGTYKIYKKASETASTAAPAILIRLAWKKHFP